VACILVALLELTVLSVSVVVLSLDPPEDFPFLILACDGVWDVFTDQEAVDLIRALSPAERLHAAHRLARRAMELGSSDNVTAVVVFL
jgi:serine/threonine protein phosphatase PrpC